MKGRKLLDAHIFNGLKKITKTIVTNVVVPRIFEIFFLFTILYILGIEKHTFVQQFSVGYEGRNRIIFCMLDSGHILFID